MTPPRAAGPVQALLDEIAGLEAAGSWVAVTLRTGMVVRLRGSLAAEFLEVFRRSAKANQQRIDGGWPRG